MPGRQKRLLRLPGRIEKLSGSISPRKGRSLGSVSEKGSGKNLRRGRNSKAVALRQNDDAVRS